MSADEPSAPRAGPRHRRCPRRALRVVALGGLGEIGRNMTVFEFDGKLLIVDCGVLFPEDNQPGVDLILPDFDYMRDRLDDVVGLVLTHGHEDHIGGVPYLLRERADIPIYGSKLTLALLAAKLREHRIRPETQRSSKASASTVAPFDLEFVAVNHSIPDALAVAIRTPAEQLVVHTGDFKMDQLPLDGRVTDLRALARLGEEGVDLIPGRLDQRRGAGFRRVRARHRPCARPSVRPRAERRIIVASFASHIHRIQQILDIARRQRSQGGIRRTVDGAQHERRARPGVPHHPRRHGRSTRRQSSDYPDDGVVLDLHRFTR